MTLQEHWWLFGIKLRSVWIVAVEPYPWREKLRMLLRHYTRNVFLYNPWKWRMEFVNKPKWVQITRIDRIG